MHEIYWVATYYNSQMQKLHSAGATPSWSNVLVSILHSSMRLDLHITKN